MKRSLLVLMMAASSVIAMAQKGSWYIGGVAGFASTTSKPVSGSESVDTEWAFGPEAGTFLQDDIQLGLALGFSGSSSKTGGNDVESFSSLSPTVYARKFFKITDNFSTFGGVYLNFASVKQTDHTVTPANELTASGIGIRLGVGIAYALSPRFTAVGQYGLLGFQSLNFKNQGNDAGSISSFDLGVNTIGSSSALSQGNGSGAVFNIGLYYTFMP